MRELLLKYLIGNGKVALPGIGVFYLRDIPAQLDEENSRLLPPGITVDFAAGDAAPDPILQTYLSRELQVEPEKAAEDLADYSKHLQKEAADEQGASIPGIGVLKTWGDELVFQPAEIPSSFSPIFGLPGFLVQKIHASEEEVFRQETVVRTRENWWIAAILLALAGIAALFYHYYTS